MHSQLYYLTRYIINYKLFQTVNTEYPQFSSIKGRAFVQVISLQKTKTKCNYNNDLYYNPSRDICSYTPCSAFRDNTNWLKHCKIIYTHAPSFVLNKKPLNNKNLQQILYFTSILSWVQLFYSHITLIFCYILIVTPSFVVVQL